MFLTLGLAMLLTATVFLLGTKAQPSVAGMISPKVMIVSMVCRLHAFACLLAIWLLASQSSS
jgi:hypothetical protein